MSIVVNDRIGSEERYAQFIRSLKQSWIFDESILILTNLLKYKPYSNPYFLCNR